MTYFKKTGIIDNYGNDIEGTMLSQLKVASSTRLAGGVFNYTANGSAPDSNFYTVVNTAGGTSTVTNSELINTLTTTSGSQSVITTAKVARYMGANSNYFRSIIRVGDTGATNNLRQWGAIDSTSIQNGYCFQLSGTTFSVASIKAGVVTTVSSGSFNGKVASYSLDTNYHTFEIYYTNKRIQFVIDNILIHTLTATTTSLTAIQHLRPLINNANTGVGSAVSISSLVLTISRLGEVRSQSKFINLTSGTTTLKIGAGFLTQLDVNVIAAVTITVYDSTTATGTKIATLDNTKANIGAFLTNIPFDNGLTIVLSGTTDVTVVYE